jgi:ribonucleoside-diphosphate reductase alpha subunit
MDSSEMYVTKRDGTHEPVSFDKILTRVKKLGKMSPELGNIKYTDLVMKVIEQLYEGITTSEIDELTSQQCASLTTKHFDYGVLASRIVVSNHHKNTRDSFSGVMDDLYSFVDANDIHSPLLSEQFITFVRKNQSKLDEMIDYSRDYLIDYFGLKTLERAYLMKKQGVIIERPQHMWMRVAVGIHMETYEPIQDEIIERIRKTYENMSTKQFTHATPTLFNSGTPRPQMSSCYLLAMESDSIKGIYNTLGDCAAISKWAGGIGLHIHNIRATGSLIRGTNGLGTGIVPMLRVFNSTARYVNQGGKRNGSFAMYMEPWHADIDDFLQMRKNHGDEEMKARDLFYALWIPDLFMKRVKENSTWTLMCPDKCPGLSDVYGDEFVELYEKYEREERGNKTVEARKLWFKILDSQIETGTPYMLYKDAANIKSNQKNLGTIKSSNLCCEIIEHSNKDETAVCNLASIAVNRCVEPPNTDYIQTVEVFGRSGCSYCLLAKNILDKNSISYTYTLLDDDVERNEFYDKITKEEQLEDRINTVPQVFINGTRVGGYNELVNRLRPVYNYDKLHDITKTVTTNLNRVIDMNYYPTDKTKRSNFLHRPVGIGIQGLADTFAMMDLPFDSDMSRDVNKKIFETIYHASLETSCEIAKSRKEPMLKITKEYNDGNWSYNDVSGEYNTSDDELLALLKYYRPQRSEIGKLRDEWKGAYSSFEGSPAQEGILQFDMWNVEPSDRYDWNGLKENIMAHGIRNSLLVAPMPTASTSQILGNNECFEPFTSNIYLRRTIAGEFVVINKYLMEDMISLGLWNDEFKNKIIANNGSIQHFTKIPREIREKHKTVWEIPMKSLIEMARDRGAFICQSQSMNLWVENPDYQRLTAMHFFAWSSGLKTGLYYLRTKAKAAAQQFTIAPPSKNTTSSQSEDEECVMCSG